MRASARGAIDTSPGTFSWTIDTSGPTVELTSGPSEGEVTGRDVTFVFFAEPGARFFCALDELDLQIILKLTDEQT